MRAVDDGPRCGDESVPTVALLPDAEQRHRAMSDIELHRHAPTPLAVVNAKAAKHGSALADGKVGRTVVAHLDDVRAEIERLELSERTARAQPVEDQHRETGSQLVLAGKGDTTGGEQRSAEDHPGRDTFVCLAVETSV